MNRIAALEKNLKEKEGSAAKRSADAETRPLVEMNTFLLKLISKLTENSCLLVNETFELSEKTFK